MMNDSVRRILVILAMSPTVNLRLHLSKIHLFFDKLNCAFVVSKLPTQNAWNVHSTRCCDDPMYFDEPRKWISAARTG
jgi:hypothetical protein